VLLMESADFGRTYTTPRNISSQVLDAAWTRSKPGWDGGFRWVATGPPGGIELANGRLLVPADIQTAPTPNCSNPYTLRQKRSGLGAGAGDGKGCTQALSMYSDGPSCPLSSCMV